MNRVYGFEKFSWRRGSQNNKLILTQNVRLQAIPFEAEVPFSYTGTLKVLAELVLLNDKKQHQIPCE